MITEDFVALTSANLHNSGVVLEDRSTREHLRVHSLLELEMGRIYVSPRGNSLRRVSQTHVLLAEKVPLAVDLVQDTPGSPGSPGRPLRFVLPGEGTDLSAPLSLGASLSEQGPAWACASPATTQDGLDSADTTSALTYLRMLSAEPDAAKLRSLHEVRHEHTPRTLLSLLLCPPSPTCTCSCACTYCSYHTCQVLDSQPPSSSWFASFLALDGAQALLDVLSHSQVQYRYSTG
tara:strand:- start:155 stop:856 length:702 start_codon:yes stop_codon:yes gene_type:complete